MAGVLVLRVLQAYHQEAGGLKYRAALTGIHWLAAAHQRSFPEHSSPASLPCPRLSTPQASRLTMRARMPTGAWPASCLDPWWRRWTTTPSSA